MQTPTSNYKCSLAFAFALFLFSSISFAETRTINCFFSPHLVCSDNNTIRWDDSRFTDVVPLTTDENNLYISQNDSVYSFDLVSGVLLWKVETKPEVRYFFPVIDQDYVYLTRSDGVIEKRLAKTGEIVWSKTLDKDWVYPPLIVKDQVITGGKESKIWILSNSKGNLLNTINLKQELVAPLTIIDNQIIASTFDNKLSAFKLDGHKTMWQTTLNAPAFKVEKQNSDVMLVSDMGGKVSLVGNKTGKIRWQRQLHPNARFWNTLHKHTFYSLGISGSLKILDIDSGKLKKSLQLEGRFAQPPIVQGDLLSMFNTNGSVQRIPLGN